MDDLTPPLLIAIREIRWNLMTGRSLKESLVPYLQRHSDELAVKLNELWSLKLQGNLRPQNTHFSSHRTQALWDLIERGHQGQPILEPLLQLEDDVEGAAGADLDAHIASLPFKALVPLLLFQFPAFVVLLLGPLLRELTRFTLAAGLVLVAKSSAAYAESLNGAAVRRIAAARNLAEVSRIQEDFDAIRVSRLACQLQLLEKTVPSACYQALHLESVWRLHPDRTRTKHLIQRMDKRCADATSRLNRLDGIDARFLSAKCRHDVARARELWAYKLN